MSRTAFTTLKVYQLSERVAHAVWDLVIGWDSFARDTVGKQVVRSADSIGANISEGYGRGSDADNKRFVRTARGSLNETTHFLRRAYRRGLLTQAEIDELKPIMDELGPRLNAYLNAIGRSRLDDAKRRPTNN